MDSRRLHSKMYAGDENLSVILIGRTGTGKSSTGNTLLGQKCFVAKRGGTSVTERCKSKSVRSKSKSFTVVDTPGLFDTSPLAKRAMEIQKSINICPKPNAFLLVMNPGRVTPEELCTIEMLKMIFGQIVLNHTIVVFTRGSEFESDAEFEEFWKETPEYRSLIRACGNRVCRLENKQPLSLHDNRVYHLVCEVSDFGSIHYSYDYAEQHEEAFRHHLEHFDGDMDSIAQIQAILRGIDHRIKSENKRRDTIAEKERKLLEKQILKSQRDLENAERKLESAEQRLASADAREKRLNRELRRQQNDTDKIIDKMDDIQDQMKHTEKRLKSAEKKLRREKKKRKSLKKELERMKESDSEFSYSDEDS